jgi:hypothetical protein
VSKPLVIFPVPDTAMRDYLRPLCLARAEAYAPNTVTADFPASLTSGTHLQVELEAGNTEDFPVTERAQVRFTLWAPAGKRSDVLNAASLVMGLVYAHPGDSDVAGCRILGGRSDVIEDPDTGFLMCWFIARVDLLATLLAS